MKTPPDSDCIRCEALASIKKRRGLRLDLTVPLSGPKRISRLTDQIEKVIGSRYCGITREELSEYERRRGNQ